MQYSNFTRKRLNLYEYSKIEVFNIFPLFLKFFIENYSEQCQRWLFHFKEIVIFIYRKYSPKFYLTNF